MINNFEIKNYKCFKDFKVEGLSQINIISGDNNVGKSAFLEAIYINLNAHMVIQSIVDENVEIRSYFKALKIISKNRGINEQGFIDYMKNINFETTINKKKFSIKYENNLPKKELSNYTNLASVDSFEFLTIQIIGDKIIYPFEIIKQMEHTKISQSYIDSSKPINKKLLTLYSSIQNLNLQHKFSEYLKLIDKNITWIEPQLIGNDLYLRINLKNPIKSLLSSELGEGTNRFIEILATLLTKQNRVILIDEIENGIHYTKLKDIWKAIIEIVQKEKIQLFVTTHDKETIEALNEASEELGFEDITSIKLKKDKNNVIYPVIRKSSLFNTTIDCGMDIR